MTAPAFDSGANCRQMLNELLYPTFKICAELMQRFGVLAFAEPSPIRRIRDNCHEISNTVFLPNAAGHHWPLHAAWRVREPAKRPCPIDSASDRGRPAVPEHGPLSIPDLPFLHQGAPGNASPYVESRTARRAAAWQVPRRSGAGWRANQGSLPEDHRCGRQHAVALRVRRDHQVSTRAFCCRLNHIE